MPKTHIITGHYGSGKTEFCVNLALDIARNTGEKVTIADMDVINPYFRSREKAQMLAAHGITVMGDCLDLNTGQDIPAVSYAFLSRINRGENVIVDLGGGENGIKLLAACYKTIIDNSEQWGYNFLCVLNLFRHETGTAEKMTDFIRHINSLCKIPITALVNNGHMLHDTEGRHVLESQSASLEVARTLGLPLQYNLIKSDVYEQIKGDIKSEKVLSFDSLQMREVWQ